MNSREHQVFGLELATLQAEPCIKSPTESSEAYLARLLGLCGLLDGRFEALYLAGGHAVELDAAIFARELGMAVWIAADPVFSAEAGGLAWLEERQLSGLVCDLGQTALKVSYAGRRWHFLRCQKKLPPVFPPHQPEFIVSQRAALADFLVTSLGHVLEEVGGEKPSGSVFGLPGKVRPGGVPYGSNYGGLHKNADLIPQTLAALQLAAIPCFLCNDAELTALSATHDPRLHPYGRILVLTVGTALGAAVIERSQG